ncbi:MAG TPA: sialidase family protein [Anaerolineales bacterium]|nr:sialidase family protein [Anaerolineales bacterium]
MTMRLARQLRLLILALTAACAAGALQETTPVKPVSPGGPPQEASGERPKGPEYAGPELAIGQEGRLYLRWFAAEPRKSVDILLSRSEDRGATWSWPPVSLKPAEGARVSGLAMASDPKGGLWVVWREVDRDGRRYDLVLMRSQDGAQWGEGRRALGSGPDLGIPRLLADRDGHVVVAWLKGSPKGHRDLEIARSSGSAATFASKLIRLSAAFPRSRFGIMHPELTSDGGGNLYVVWEETPTPTDFRIYLNRSLDWGKTWATQPILVSAPEEGAYRAHKPQILAAPKERVYVIWEQTDRSSVTLQQPGRGMIPDRLIYVNRSLDHGQTWLPKPIRLNEARPEPIVSLDPQLSTDQGGHVYAIWLEVEGPDTKGPLFARSSDSGMGWSKPGVRLDLTSPFWGRPARPMIRSDEAGHVWVLWQELIADQQQWKLLMNRSDDRGLTWRPHAIPLASSPQRGGRYRGVAFDHDGQGRLYVAWDGGPGNAQEIYVNRSADFGATWLPREVRVGRQ